MKTQRGWIAVVTGALALGGVLGWRVRASRADGIPQSTPLAYGGFLENNGTPVDGTQNLTLNVWRSAAGMAPTDQVCTTVAANTSVAHGFFRVNLSASCTAAVASTPDLWIEVVVAGTSLGRTPIAPLPFAVEANRAHVAATANAAAGALDTRISAVESTMAGLTALTARVAALETGTTPGNAPPHGWTVFRKDGDNGTAACGTFCAGSQWGRVGTCIAAVRTDNNTQVDCATSTGLIAGGELACVCVEATP